MYDIRKAEFTDMAQILVIIQGAQAYLKQQGLPQWQNGYGPGEASVSENISKNEGYVLLYKERVCGYAALVSGVDEVYTDISEGSWMPGYEPYISIHSVALDTTVRGQGLAKLFLTGLADEAAAAGYRDIRIDTHPDNKIMEKAILHAGFSYRGMVSIPIPDGERRAYQRIITE